MTSRDAQPNDDDEKKKKKKKQSEKKMWTASGGGGETGRQKTCMCISLRVKISEV
jgi:hypothetical protein